jgi:hypothetical protein
MSSSHIYSRCVNRLFALPILANGFEGYRRPILRPRCRESTLTRMLIAARAPRPAPIKKKIQVQKNPQEKRVVMFSFSSPPSCSLSFFCRSCCTSSYPSLAEASPGKDASVAVPSRPTAHPRNTFANWTLHALGIVSKKKAISASNQSKRTRKLQLILFFFFYRLSHTANDRRRGTAFRYS